jgi:hypothetical protein
VVATRTALIVTLSVVAGCSEVMPPPPQSRGADATARPGESASEAPTQVPLESFDAAAAPTGWTQVAEFGGAGELDVAGAVHAGGIYLIVGGVTVGQPGDATFRTEARLWRSVDAASWTGVALPDPMGLEVVALVPAPDEGFLLSGLRYSEDGDRRIVLLRSADGVEWAAAETDLPGSLFVDELVRGPEGYVLLTERSDDLGASLWFSTDGVSWDRAHDLTESSNWVQVADLAAGSQGFMAFGMHVPEAEGPWIRASVVSQDGREWTDVDQPFGDEDLRVRIARLELGVSEFDGEWVAAVASPDAAAEIFRSADGRTWEAVDTIDGETVPMGSDIRLLQAGEELYLGILPQSAPLGAMRDRIWRSPDAERWEALSFGPITTLGGVAAGAHGAILAGVTGASGEVTVWLRR